MFNSRHILPLVCFACLNALAVEASGQTVAPQPAYPPPAAPQPVGAQPAAPGTAVAPMPAPAAAPAPAPAAVAPAPAAQYAAPPGYAMVPIGSAPQPRPGEASQDDLIREQETISSYQEGDPVPEGYRVIQESRRGLVIAGSIVGGIAYGLSVVAAVGADFEEKSGALMIPVAGPWIMLALGGAKNKTCTSDYSYSSSSLDDCGDRSDVRAALALSGITQVVGATMLVAGLAFPRTRLVKKNVQLSMAPMSFGKDGYGFGAIGRF